MKIFKAVFLSIFIQGFIHAQTSLTGRVTDINGNALVGASVYLPEQNKGCYTVHDGKYLIENLPTGKISIQFSFMGYNTVVKTLILKKGVNEVNVTLSEAVIESQQVVISSGYITSQHENALKIEILNNKDISIAGTPNFTEALTKIPGVDMISKGSGVSKPVIRGLSMNDILVMNNGVRIENYQFSENHPLGIDNNDVERVEIIKGPASLIYGSDAIGGVINFIKEKPAPKNSIAGDFRTQLHSNTLGTENSLGVKANKNNFFAGFRINQKTHADYKQGGNKYVPNSRFNEWSLSSNAAFTSKTGTFKLHYDYFKQALGMTVPPIVQLISEQARKNNIWYQDLEHHLISSQNKIYFGNLKWETNIAYQSALRKLIKTSDIPSVEMNLNTLTYESKLNVSLKESTEYILGIQGLYQKNINKNNREAQFLPDADINNVGIISFLQHQVFNKVKLQGGLRFDTYHTRTYALGLAGTETFHPSVIKNFSSLNGAAGLTYNYDENLLFRGNFAKAYRVPNLSELTSRGEHGNRFEIGNADLQPEDAYEWDISSHYHAKYISFDIAGFYNIINNYIYITPTSDTSLSGMLIYQFSQDNALLYGGEAGLHIHPGMIPWLHVKGVFSSVIGKQSTGGYLPYIPAHKFRYEIRADKEKFGFLQHPNIWLSASNILEQNSPSQFETKTPGYTLIDGGFNTEIKIKKHFFTCGITINNIFDVSYYAHLSTLKPMGYCNQGRNICIFIKIPFATI